MSNLTLNLMHKSEGISSISQNDRLKIEIILHLLNSPKPLYSSVENRLDTTSINILNFKLQMYFAVFKNR